MAPQDRYLSTDPNAGAEPSETGQVRYLSQDPNAGSASPDAGAPPEDKTVAGFLGNVVSSGANFVGNAVKGAGMVGGAMDAMLRGPMSPSFDDTMRVAQSMQGAGPRLLQGAKDYFSNRYGSMEALGDTVYQDPVGVAADASTLLSAGGAALGTVPGRVGQAGRALSAAGSASDPAALAVRATGAVARPAVRGAEAVAGMLDNVPAGVGGVGASDMALGGLTGMLSHDPYTALATTAGSALLRSPMARQAAASGLRGAGQVMTRAGRAAEVSPEMLTRLAILAKLNQGTPGGQP